MAIRTQASDGHADPSHDLSGFFSAGSFPIPRPRVVLSASQNTCGTGAEARVPTASGGGLRRVLGRTLGRHPMNETQAAGCKLVSLAEPYLRRRDFCGLVERLDRQWSPDCLSLLLLGDDPEVVEVAAACLGLVGDMSASEPLARLLHHDLASIVKAAENALWAVWFRGAGPVAQAALTRIAASIRLGEPERIVPLLTELTRTYPSFAEAFHQRSQAYFLRGAFTFAIRDAERAVTLNPYHFAALANQAHARAALGQYTKAAALYRSVLQLHPRFPGIRSALGRIGVRQDAIGV